MTAQHASFQDPIELCHFDASPRVRPILHAIDDVSLHIHPALEILIVATGEVGFCSNGEVFRLRSGDIAIAQSWQPHATHALGLSNSALALQIDSSLFQRDALYTRRSFDFQAFVASRDNKPALDRIRALTIGMFFETKTKRSAWQIAIEGMALELQTLFLRHVPNYLNDENSPQETPDELKQMGPTLVRAADFARAHARENLTLEDVADASHISPSYLARLFKSKTQGTFKEFLTRIRLRQSLEQLTSGKEELITHIALDNGFPNVKAYNLAFKRFFGISPRDLRKSSSAETQKSPYQLFDEAEAMKALQGLLQSANQS